MLLSAFAGIDIFDRAKFRASSLESQQRQHSPGFPSFEAVGIITVRMRRGASPAIVNLPHAGGATLGHDESRKIDLEMGWTDARAKLNDDFGRIAVEFGPHALNGYSSNPQLASLATGM
jgi:hypothetical protein